MAIIVLIILIVLAILCGISEQEELFFIGMPIFAAFAFMLLIGLIIVNFDIEKFLRW